MDYQGLPGDILDEIALEGLDGITISGNRKSIHVNVFVSLKGHKMCNVCQFSFVDPSANS